MSIYLTAILPPEQLASEIDEIRKEISEKYKVYAALKPPVHITLYRPLSMEASNEDFLIKLLKPVGYSHKPFQQRLENFDSFNNKTLFIHADKNPLLQVLQSDIAAVYNKNKIDVKEQKSSDRFHPHITIAYRDVQRNVFKELWQEFKNRKFRRHYITDRFCLLKHDGKRWNLLEEFLLQQTETPTLF